MYRDSLYSNTTTSSRKGGGSWICINGELYHYGRPGMQWGKHLPGTEWWKTTTNKYYAQHPNIQSVAGGRRYAAQPTFGTKVKANVYATGQAIKEYGQTLNRATKYEVAKKAGTSYAMNRLDARKQGIDPKRTDMTHLEKFMAKQIESGRDYYENLAYENDSWKNLLNLSIKNASYNIVNGVNNFLNKHGLADKVDNFLSKFLGKSGKMLDTESKTLVANAKKRHLERREQNQAVKNNTINAKADSYKYATSSTFGTKKVNPVYAANVNKKRKYDSSTGKVSIR